MVSEVHKKFRRLRRALAGGYRRRCVLRFRRGESTEPYAKPPFFAFGRLRRPDLLPTRFARVEGPALDAQPEAQERCRGTP